MPLFKKCEEYVYIRELVDKGIYPYFHELESKQDIEVMMEGKRRIMLGSNNYLGLTVNQEVIDAGVEAMKKYGEAAMIEMIMNALPEIAKNVAEPLSKVDKITMYGEGNSAKLLSDIVNGTTQVTEGISAGMGLDLKSLLAGALGGKLAAGNSQPVQVTVAPQAQPDAAAASADTPEQQV